MRNEFGITDKWVLAWVPANHDDGDVLKAGEIKLGPFKNNLIWAGDYAHTIIGFQEWHGRDKRKVVATLFRLFCILVTDAGIDPKVALKEFMKIREFRDDYEDYYSWGGSE